MNELLVLQHHPGEDLGVIGDFLRREGLAWRVIRPYMGEPVPRDVTAARGVIALGGPMSAYDTGAFPFLRDEISLLQAALDAGKPVLGICLGSQLLAAALGARVYPGKEKEIGWGAVQLTLDFRADRLFAEVPTTFMALHWHGDVFELPKGAISLGHSAKTRHQGFRHGANAYGLLFHLEVTPALVRNMISSFEDELGAAGASAEVIERGLASHMAEVQQTGDKVFTALARLCKQEET